jgi:anti-sigma factor RsiW
MADQALSCQQLVELVTDFLEGALPAQQAAAVELHLAACESCRTYLEQLRQTIGLLKALPDDTLNAETCDELLTRFRAWAQER